MPYRVLEPRFPLGEDFMTTVTAEGTDPDEVMKILLRHHSGAGEISATATIGPTRKPFYPMSGFSAATISSVAPFTS